MGRSRRRRHRENKRGKTDDVTTEDLANITEANDAITDVLNDLDLIQEAKWTRCREVSLAIAKLEEAQMWLERREDDLYDEVESTDKD